MSKTTLPTSKAKTAYGLLSDVRRVILAEPKRYNQKTWLERYRPAVAMVDDTFPACGTIGCVAGWTAVLASCDGIPANIRLAAEIVLGLETEQAAELFSSTAVRWSLDAGTRQYAQAGARHIRKFQQKYAKQLKATKVRR